MSLFVRKLFDDSRTSSLSATQLGIGLTVLQCVVAIPVVWATIAAAPPSASVLLSKNNQNDRAIAAVEEGEQSASSSSLSSSSAFSSLSKLLNSTLPETMANVFMYGPAAVIAYWKAGFLQLGTATAVTTNPSSRVPLLLLTHFGKKAIEKIIMKGQTTGSGSSHSSNNNLVPEEEIPVVAIVQTATFCGIGTYLVAAQALPVPAGVDLAQVVFWLGQFGNSFHVYVLEQYQKKTKVDVGSSSSTSGTQQRSRVVQTIPNKGGLYQYNIAAPQLLFELVACWGIAASARSLYGYVQAGLAVMVIGYQAKRLNDKATAAASEEEDNAAAAALAAAPRSVIGAATGDEAVAAATPPLPTVKKRWNLIPYVY